MTRKRSIDVKEIPLYLLPKVISRQIRKAGDLVYRISVKRTHWHHYNVSVRTKSFRKELAPLMTATIADGELKTVRGKSRTRAGCAT